MSDLIDQIFGELSALPPRRGLFAEDLPRRIGPILRGLAEIGPDDDEFASREKLVHWLDRVLWTVPAPERHVVSVAIGMHPQTKDRTSLALRLEYLQQERNRDVKTVRRWLKMALQRVAKSAVKQITEGPDAADSGWYVESLHSLLRLDTASPVAHEDRRIVATRHGLRELSHRASLPRPSTGDGDRPLEVDLDYGGRLRLDYATETDYRYLITLGRPLDWGERHDLRITTRLPAGYPMAPHYTCVPQRRIDRFVLRVRFDRTRLPAQVRSIDCGSPRSADCRVTAGSMLAPDESGEIRVEFADLRAGYSYGLQWTEG